MGIKLSIAFDPATAGDIEEVEALLAKLKGDAPEEDEAPAKPAKSTKAKADKPAKAKEPEPEPEPEEEPATTYTVEEVRKALKEYAALEGKAAAVKILTDNGADSIGELEESKFLEVIKAAGGELHDEDKDEDDD